MSEKAFTSTREGPAEPIMLRVSIEVCADDPAAGERVVRSLFNMIQERNGKSNDYMVGFENGNGVAKVYWVDQDAKIVKGPST